AQEIVSLLLIIVLAKDRMRPIFTNAFSKLVNPENPDILHIDFSAPLENGSETFIRSQFKEDILAKCALEIEPKTSFTGLG
ncbi:2478_t:CDS:2, partial [Racocetra persica]